MTNQQLIPALLTPLILWRYYRRFRRNVGRQPLVPRRMVFLFVVMTLAIPLVGLGAGRDAVTLASFGGAIALGFLLGAVGVRLVRFEVSDGKRFYTPNPYLGVGITLLFAGRLIYRMIGLFSLAGRETAPGANALEGLHSSPATMAVLGLLMGYYLVFSAGVWGRGRALAVGAG